MANSLLAQLVDNFDIFNRYIQDSNLISCNYLIIKNNNNKNKKPRRYISYFKEGGGGKYQVL